MYSEQATYSDKSPFWRKIIRHSLGATLPVLMLITRPSHADAQTTYRDFDCAKTSIWASHSGEERAQRLTRMVDLIISANPEPTSIDEYHSVVDPGAPRMDAAKVADGEHLRKVRTERAFLIIGGMETRPVAPPRNMIS